MSEPRLRDAGGKAFVFSELVRREVAKFVVADVNAQWSGATVVGLYELTL
jgi:hypothetical protein